MLCTPQDPGIQLSTGRRIFIFILGITDSLLFGGAVFGWPQLVFILKSDNIFSDLCEDSLEFHLNGSEFSAQNGTWREEIIENFNIRCISDITHNISDIPLDVQKDAAQDQCTAQNERFVLIFMLSVVCYGVPGIAIGFCLHYIGLRTTRLFGGLLVSASFLCLSATTRESWGWLFPAMMLLGLGGNTLRMSGMQMGDLFPRHRSTAITFLSGMYAGSASLFLVFSMMADLGISRSLVSFFFAAIAASSALLSFIMPIHHIPYHEEIGNEVSKKSTPVQLPLKESFFSLSSYLHQYWFFICLVIVNIYQQTYNVWITASSCTLEEAGVYSKWFSYSNLVAVFMAPVGGFFTDRMISRVRKGNYNEIDYSVKEIEANFIPLLLTTVIELIMYICLFFFHPIAIIVSLVTMTIVRPCIIAISTAYLRIRFPASHFNRLLGIYSTVSSVLMFLQYPHFQWSQQSYYLAHSVTLAFLVLCLLNPCHLLWTSYLRNQVRKRLAKANPFK